MNVVDINGKEREVEYVKKINHDSVDVISGEPVSEVFVEVKILGHTRNWIEWWPFDEFKKYNPKRRPRFKK